jgi:hypothetical protein
MARPDTCPAKTALFAGRQTAAVVLNSAEMAVGHFSQSN